MLSLENPSATLLRESIGWQFALARRRVEVEDATTSGRNAQQCEEVE
ncbi:hypothetical protein PR003_g34316 [Phytophthora rubi]|nr:hypothetical protein PR003_g34316 [Phytophthora rubi]